MFTASEWTGAQAMMPGSSLAALLVCSTIAILTVPAAYYLVVRYKADANRLSRKALLSIPTNNAIKVIKMTAVNG